MRDNMIDKPVVAILRAGPETTRGPKAPETSIPFVIEVQTTNGPAVLQFGPQAAAVAGLRGEIDFRMSQPAKRDCHGGHAMWIEPGLRPRSPENGNI
jgi:hypothetical protein